MLIETLRLKNTRAVTIGPQQIPLGLGGEENPLRNQRNPRQKNPLSTEIRENPCNLSRRSEAKTESVVKPSLNSEFILLNSAQRNKIRENSCNLSRRSEAKTESVVKTPPQQRNLRNQRQKTLPFYAKRTQFLNPQNQPIPFAGKALHQIYNFVESQKRTQTNPILSRRSAAKTDKPNPNPNQSQNEPNLSFGLIGFPSPFGPAAPPEPCAER